MSSKVQRDARRPNPRCIGLVTRWLCILSLFARPGQSQASDLQRSTDSAAVDAKRDLCIALNRGAATPEVAARFFAFYDGEIVSASRLHPDTLSTGQIGPLPAFKVLQVLGPNELLASINAKICKLRGVSTADMADDQVIRLADFFLVGSTETYSTVGGSTNTVYVLEPARGRMPRVEATRIYPWYDRKDEVVVVGEFKLIDGSNAVFLERGSETRVPLSKFTRGDRDLMRLLMDRYPQAQPEGASTEKTRAAAAKRSAAQPVGID